MSVLLLGTLGGLISFASTSVGALSSIVSDKLPSFFKFKFSIDFALGLMLSAVAFSLVAPAASQSMSNPQLLVMSALGFLVGGLAIHSLKGFVEKRTSPSSTIQTSQLVLALALIVHNFPEGLASGASLAGLSSSAATPILASISIQNVPEGLLMVLCLKAMGWSSRNSLLGGIGSGLVELVGGVTAGAALGWTSGALPVILMMAGGAMFTSVVIELREDGKIWSHLKRPEFAMGLASIPFLDSLLG